METLKRSLLLIWKMRQTLRRRGNREFRKQAALMVAGRQDAERELPYLVDRLREMVGKNRLFDTVCAPEDEVRIGHLSECLSLGRRGEPFVCLESDERFGAALHEHATGYVVPIIKELVVRWDSPILKEGHCADRSSWGWDCR